MKTNNVEVIRALTPWFLATIGGAIGLGVLLAPGLSEAKWAAGFGLAGTAIAGAAGLAQPNKTESRASEREEQQVLNMPN